MKYLLLLILMISTTAQAEMPDWYQDAVKVKNPNELPLYTSVSKACKAMSSAELNTIVEGVLVRSRIKPIPLERHVIDPKEYPIYLNVILSCFDETPYPYSVDVSFGKAMPRPSMLMDYQYGSYGRDDMAGIKGEVKEQTERAVVDYLRINFGL